MFDFDAAFDRLKAEKIATDGASRKQREAEHHLLSDLYSKLDAFRSKWSIPIDTRLEEGVLEASKNPHETLKITTYGDQKFDVKRVRAGRAVAGSDLDAIALDEAAVTDYLVRWAVE